MKKEIIIILLTYLITSIIRGFIIAYTGFSFINLFHDAFELIPFMPDIIIWTVIYIGVRLVIDKLDKKTV